MNIKLFFLNLIHILMGLSKQNMRTIVEKCNNKSLHVDIQQYITRLL